MGYSMPTAGTARGKPDSCVGVICAKAEERIMPHEARARRVFDVEPSFVCCSHG
jgi:hypothetical protein